MQNLDKLRHDIVSKSASLKLATEMLGKVSEDREQQLLEMLADGTRQLSKNIADYKQYWFKTISDLGRHGSAPNQAARIKIKTEEL